MLHISSTNLPLLTAKQDTYKEANLFMKNIEEFSGKSSEERTSRQKKKRQKGDRTRQKNKRGDSKVESNDSPGIPDRGKTSDIPGLPSGLTMTVTLLWDCWMINAGAVGKACSELDFGHGCKWWTGTCLN